MSHMDKMSQYCVLAETTVFQVLGLRERAWTRKRPDGLGPYALFKVAMKDNGWQECEITAGMRGYEKPKKGWVYDEQNGRGFRGRHGKIILPLYSLQYVGFELRGVTDEEPGDGC